MSEVTAPAPGAAAPQRSVAPPPAKRRSFAWLIAACVAIASLTVVLLLVLAQ